MPILAMRTMYRILAYALLVVFCASPPTIVFGMPPPSAAAFADMVAQRWFDTSSTCGGTQDLYRTCIVDPAGSIVQLSFSPQIQLKGTISPAVVSLPQLQAFTMVSERIVGPLPPIISAVHLQTLTLNCKLSGKLPALAGLDELRVLDLSGNEFSGNLPIVNLPALDTLFLKDNKLSGSIPALVAPLLKMLDLSRNDFTGTVPDVTGLPSLQMIGLVDNHLTGSLRSANFPVTTTVSLRGNELCVNADDSINFRCTDCTSVALPTCAHCSQFVREPTACIGSLGTLNITCNARTCTAATCCFFDCRRGFAVDITMKATPRRTCGTHACAAGGVLLSGRHCPANGCSDVTCCLPAIANAAAVVVLDVTASTLAFTVVPPATPKQLPAVVSASPSISSIPTTVPTPTPPALSAPACAEGGSLDLSCGGSETIAEITFASYGNPSGCPMPTAALGCHAASSMVVTSQLCVGKQTCTLVASDALFGSVPCIGINKRLAVMWRCAPAEQTCVPSICSDSGFNKRRVPLPCRGPCTPAECCVGMRIETPATTTVLTDNDPETCAFTVTETLPEVWLQLNVPQRVGVIRITTGTTKLDAKSYEVRVGSTRERDSATVCHSSYPEVAQLSSHNVQCNFTGSWVLIGPGSTTNSVPIELCEIEVFMGLTSTCGLTFPGADTDPSGWRRRANFDTIVCASARCAYGECLIPRRAVPSGVTTFNGHRYEFFAADYQGNDAFNAAQEMGGYLVSLESEAERAHVDRWMAGQSYWLGGRQTQSGEWRWIDHRSRVFWRGGITGYAPESAFSFWKSAQPDGRRSQDCLFSSRSADTNGRTWEARACTTVINGLVVEHGTTGQCSGHVCLGGRLKLRADAVSCASAVCTDFECCDGAVYVSCAELGAIGQGTSILNVASETVPSSIALSIWADVALRRHAAARPSIYVQVDDGVSTVAYPAHGLYRGWTRLQDASNRTVPYFSQGGPSTISFACNSEAFAMRALYIGTGDPRSETAPRLSRCPQLTSRFSNCTSFEAECPVGTVRRSTHSTVVCQKATCDAADCCETPSAPTGGTCVSAKVECTGASTLVPDADTRRCPPIDGCTQRVCCYSKANPVDCVGYVNSQGRCADGTRLIDDPTSFRCGTDYADCSVFTCCVQDLTHGLRCIGYLALQPNVCETNGGWYPVQHQFLNRTLCAPTGCSYEQCCVDPAKRQTRKGHLIAREQNVVKFLGMAGFFVSLLVFIILGLALFRATTKHPLAYRVYEIGIPGSVYRIEFTPKPWKVPVSISELGSGRGSSLHKVMVFTGTVTAATIGVIIPSVDAFDDGDNTQSSYVAVCAALCLFLVGMFEGGDRWCINWKEQPAERMKKSPIVKLHPHIFLHVVGAIGFVLCSCFFGYLRGGATFAFSILGLAFFSLHGLISTFVNNEIGFASFRISNQNRWHWRGCWTSDIANAALACDLDRVFSKLDMTGNDSVTVQSLTNGMQMTFADGFAFASTFFESPYDPNSRVAIGQPAVRGWWRWTQRSWAKFKNWLPHRMCRDTSELALLKNVLDELGRFFRDHAADQAAERLSEAMVRLLSEYPRSGAQSYMRMFCWDGAQSRFDPHEFNYDSARNLYVLLFDYTVGIRHDHGLHWSDAVHQPLESRGSWARADNLAQGIGARFAEDEATMANALPHPPMRRHTRAEPVAPYVLPSRHISYPHVTPAALVLRLHRELAAALPQLAHGGSFRAPVPLNCNVYSTFWWATYELWRRFGPSDATPLNDVYRGVIAKLREVGWTFETMSYPADAMIRNTETQEAVFWFIVDNIWTPTGERPANEPDHSILCSVCGQHIATDMSMRQCSWTDCEPSQQGVNDFLADPCVRMNVSVWFEFLGLAFCFLQFGVELFWRAKDCDDSGC